jgi:hypothetical protein
MFTGIIGEQVAHCEKAGKKRFGKITVKFIGNFPGQTQRV